MKKPTDWGKDEGSKPFEDGEDEGRQKKKGGR
jgi:hypothetical protein